MLFKLKFIAPKFSEHNLPFITCENAQNIKHHQ